MIRLLGALAAAALLSACRISPEAEPAAAVADDTSGVAVPAVAVTSGGATFTTSVVGQGESRRLVVTRPDGEAVEVARGGVSDHSQAAPRLVAAPDGALLVLYAVDVDVPGRHFPASDLFLARSTDTGRTFGAPARVSPDGGVPTGHTFADVAVGRDGAVVVSWLDETAQDAWTRAHPAPSEARTAEAGGARGDSAGQADPHHEAAAHGGTVHSSDGPGATLVVARSEDGRTFGAPVAVAGGVCPCCRTALDVGLDGSVRVVWRHVWPGGERDPAIATSRDGGRTFAAPVRVHEDRWAIDGCPHAGPAVAAGMDGRVHVAWYTGTPGRAGLWHAVSDDGGATFADPTALAARAPLGQTRAARDGQGRVWLAWEDRGDAAAGGARVHVAAAAGGDTTTVAGVDPALAGGAAGWTLAVVDGGSVRLHSRRADPAP